MQESNPYATPQAAVEEFAAPEELRLGGRGERLGAVILDLIIHVACCLAIFLPVLWLTGWWRSFLEMMMRGEFSVPVTIAMSLSGFLVYVAVQGYPLASTGQTWGKRLLKLRIVDLRGHKPDFARLIGLRYGVGWLVSAVPVLGPIYSIADAVLIFRGDKRCIHDHIAGTRVVVAD